MKIFRTLFQGNSWLFLGSCCGGSTGAIIVHLNALFRGAGSLAITTSVDLSYSTGLGMVGGIIGGVVGSFVAGMLVKSDVVFNLGASLGIGLINGFISGAITGLLIGVIHSWYPHLISPAAMFMALAVVICAAFIISLFWKKEE